MNAPETTARDSMRILYLTSNIEPWDGTGAFSLGMISAAARAGFEPVVLTPTHAKESSKASTPGCDVYGVLPSHKNRNENPLKIWRDARNVLRDAPVSDIAVVHCLFERYILLASKLAEILGAPLIVSAIGSYAIEPFERRGGAVRRTLKALQKAQTVIAISEFTAERLRPHLPGVTIKVAHPGFEVGSVEAKPPDSARREPVILSVGAVKRRKGQGALVRAFALLAERFPEWKCIIVGREDEKAYASDIKALVSKCGLGERVEFTGRADAQVRDALFRRASVFALAPCVDDWKIEGFGIAFLEAAAFELPIVCTSECGFSELVRGEDGCGIVAESADPRAFTTALEQLMNDAELRTRMGKEAAKIARAHSWDERFKSIAEAYRRAAGREIPGKSQLI